MQFALMNDCCVCGEWKLRSQLQALDSKNLNPKCLRYLNTTLDEKYVCYRCSTRCPICKCAVTRAHCDLQNGLKDCKSCTGRAATQNKLK